MNLQRYVLTQGVLLEDKTIIPIWDSRLEFVKTEMYGNTININDGNIREKFHDVVQCIYDLKTKTISAGIDLDIYPDLTKLNHKVNDIVLFENKWNHTLSKIVDIIFEEYDLEIIKGKKIEGWVLNNLPKDTLINKDFLYSIKNWRPTYVLDNGNKTIWDMYLRKIENLDYLQK